MEVAADNQVGDTKDKVVAWAINEIVARTLRLGKHSNGLGRSFATTCRNFAARSTAVLHHAERDETSLAHATREHYMTTNQHIMPGQPSCGPSK